MKVVNKVEAVVGKLDWMDSERWGLLVGGRREHLSYGCRWLIDGEKGVDQFGSLLELCSWYLPRLPWLHRVQILNSLALGDTVGPLNRSCTCGSGRSVWQQRRGSTSNGFKQVESTCADGHGEEPVIGFVLPRGVREFSQAGTSVEARVRKVDRILTRNIRATLPHFKRM